MPDLTLTPNEQNILAHVLELRLNLTRKSTPSLQPLSFYSSELKGTKQIAKHLRDVQDSKDLSDNPISRARYFNTLANQGLLEGTSGSPILTTTAQHYLGEYEAHKTDEDFWRGDGGNLIELNVIRDLVGQLSAGTHVSDIFKQIWFNAQTFFDNVPPEELAPVLSERERLLFLYRINSVGWEIARYFRLSEDERKQFQEAFQKVRPTINWSPSLPIEVAAAKYKDAAETVQADVRFRISGFLNAYSTLRSELGVDLPRLDRQLSLRAGSEVGGGSANIAEIEQSPKTFKPISQPHQLIVTGCPGSGKSFYVNQLITHVDCQVFRTQFHPETSFFDFVGSYKPQPVYQPLDSENPLLESNGSNSVRGRPLIDYRFVAGPLMQALAYAYANPDTTVIVLIEEINRGNAAAIFGDILQLLDRNELGTSVYTISATPEAQAYLASIGINRAELSLPGNIYIWATMNSADQGVFPLDTAFRRRWSYVYKGYTERCLYPIGERQLVYGGISRDWDVFRHTLNSRLIDLGIHEDKLIGPYFLTQNQLKESSSVLNKLFLYLWEDVLRHRQGLLFGAKSFSLVANEWASGNGDPLGLTFPIDTELPPISLTPSSGAPEAVSNDDGKGAAEPDSTSHPELTSP